MNSIFAGVRGGMPLPNQGWTAIAGVLDWLADNWDQPEGGIWGTPGGRATVPSARGVCWVAFDRGIRLATEHGRPGDVARWTVERDRVYRQVMEQGWHDSRQAFVQH